MEGLTKSAALEAAARGVRVNAVAQGPIDIDMLSRYTGSAERKAAATARSTAWTAARWLERAASTHARPHLQADDLIAFFGSPGFVKYVKKC